MKHYLSSRIAKTATTFGAIELLHRMMPPQVVIHIGAGTGNGEMHFWRHWSVPHALIIDADPVRLEWADSLAIENPAWQVRSVVLADHNNEVDYYRASNPDQDGLISPEKLTIFWPNLCISESMRRQTQRLDSLLSDQALTSFQQDLSTWLLIDCLPVLPILEGAGSDLDRWSVLWLSVLLKPLADDDTVGTLNDLEIYLRPHGYRCIHVFEDNHPAVGKALFIRDWHAQLTPVVKKLKEENSVIISEKANLEQRALAANSNLQNQIGLLTQARDEQSQLATERQAQVVALTQEKTVLAEQRQALDQEINALKQVRDEQSQLATERQAQVVALTQEKTVLAEQRQALDQEINALKQAREAQSQLATERQAQVVALTQEKTAWEEQRQALDQEINALKQAREEQSQLATERQAQVVTLTKEKTVLAEQRQALDQEINALKQLCDEQSQLAAERQAQVTVLTNEKAALFEELKLLVEEIRALNQAKDEQARIVNDVRNEFEQLQSKLQQCEIRVVTLESELVEKDVRQRMLNEEMIKAEAQIDLIKDVLLR
nr:hypothetical protein [uncultured Undibacterium sp.]